MTIPNLRNDLWHNSSMATKRSEHRTVLYVLLGTYLTAAALVAFWPTPVDATAAPWLTLVFEKLHSNGVPTWVSYDLLEFAANIIFFIPLTVLLTLLLGRSRWWFAVLVAVSASMAIEVGQLMFIAARFATLQDVAANAIGAFIGAGIVLVAKKRVPRMVEA